MESAAFTPREILRLLAEEDRLKVVAALVLGATTSAEITAATGMTTRQAGRALAGLFEPGRRYTEAEVNQTLGAWYPDYAALRRYLVDEGFLRRADETDPSTSRSAKRYWRAGGSFEVG